MSNAFGHYFYFIEACIVIRASKIEISDESIK